MSDLARVKRSGKIGVLLGLQDSEHFRRPEDVDFFHGLGQRVSQLTYNTRNMIGNGSTERRDDGISDFGVAIIERMNRVGMAVDVSHCGDRTTLDAFELSKKPSSSRTRTAARSTRGIRAPRPTRQSRPSPRRAVSSVLPAYGCS